MKITRAWAASPDFPDQEPVQLEIKSDGQLTVPEVRTWTMAVVEMN